VLRTKASSCVSQRQPHPANIPGLPPGGRQKPRTAETPPRLRDHFLELSHGGRQPELYSYVSRRNMGATGHRCGCRWTRPLLTHLSRPHSPSTQNSDHLRRPQLYFGHRPIKPNQHTVPGITCRLGKSASNNMRVSWSGPQPQRFPLSDAVRPSRTGPSRRGGGPGRRVGDPSAADNARGAENNCEANPSPLVNDSSLVPVLVRRGWAPIHLCTFY